MASAVSTVPNAEGRFGAFGGRYVPETLIAALDQLTVAYDEANADPTFQAELDYHLKSFVGRPCPLYFASRLTAMAGGARIYFKREDLNHTGAHKINNSLGQALLASRGSLLKQVPDSTALPLPRLARCLASLARFTWVKKTSAGRN